MESPKTFVRQLPAHLAAEQILIEAGIERAPAPRGIEPARVGSPATLVYTASQFDLGPVKLRVVPAFDIHPIRRAIPDFDIHPVLRSPNA